MDKINMKGLIESRVLMYTNGESVSTIANKQGVSRQAIIKTLKKAGVHKAPGVIQPKPTVVHTNVNIPIDIDKIPELSEAHRLRGISRETRIGRNLYITSNGFIVKYFHEGKLVERSFNTREEVIKAYLS